MTIRQNNLTVLVPTFFGLAAVYCALIYGLERAEVYRALEREATAAARCIAEFLPYHNQETFLNSNFIQRVLKWNSGLRVYHFSADGRLLFDTGTTAGTPAVALPQQDDLHQLVQDRVWFPPMHWLTPISDRLAAFAPIKDATNHPAQFLGVEVDTTPLRVLFRSQLEHHGTVFAMFVGFGIAISLLFSFLIERPMQRLRTAAAASHSETHVHIQNQTSRIKEICELENAVNTMTSILREVIHNAKQSLIHSGFVNVKRQFASINAELMPSSVDHEIGGRHVICRPGRSVPSGSFWAVQSSDGRTWCFVGQIHDYADELERTLQARTARRFLACQLPGVKDLGSLLQETHDYFGLAECVVFEWVHAAPAVLIQHRYFAGRIEVQKQLSTTRELLVWHTFTGDVGAILDAYVQKLRPDDAQSFMDDIEPLIRSDDTAGVIVIVSSRL